MRLPLLLSLALIASLSFAQNTPVAPVPTGPYELVTGPVKLLDETDQRASVLGLIERARQNSDLHAPGGHAFLLKVSFEASGNVPHTGSGQLEELWYAPGQWRWTSRFGSYSQTRINLKGRLFEESVSPMPLRLQMVRGTIFWPILMRPGAALRISAGTWNGAPVMCVLGSGFFGNSTAPGRHWEETEFCIDTKTGLLQTYSIAPGIYAVYNYHDAIHFHASTLPRTISIYEENNPVLQIRLDSLADAGPFDPKLFMPTPTMKGRGYGSLIAGTFRIPIAGGVSPVATDVIQPVIVHANVTADGRAEEVESLQTSDPALSAAAIAAVKNAHFPEPGRGSGNQREVFVNVRFMPSPNAQSGQ